MAQFSNFNSSLTDYIDKTSRLWFNTCMVEKALLFAFTALALMISVEILSGTVFAPFEYVVATLESVNSGETRGWEN